VRVVSPRGVSLLSVPAGPRVVHGPGFGITDYNWRARILTSLVPHLPSEQQSKVYSPALDTIRKICEGYNRRENLEKITFSLPSSLLPQAVNAAPGAFEPLFLPFVLKLSQADQTPIHVKMIDYASKKANKGSSDELRKLIPHLPLQLQYRVLATARALKCTHCKATLLATIASRLPPVEQLKLYEQALDAGHNYLSTDGQNRSTVFHALAEAVPLELLPKFLDFAQELASSYEYTEVMEVLATRMSSEQLAHALVVIDSFNSNIARCRALRTLAPYLPPEDQLGVYTRALEAIMAIGMDGKSVYNKDDAKVRELRDFILQALEIACSVNDEDGKALKALGTRLASVTVNKCNSGNAQILCPDPQTLFAQIDHECIHRGSVI
jgi:hypothetical protein